MTTFIHTSDWQLGITRRFLDSGAQERYHQARFDCIRHMARIARENDCRFAVVCGDVFESNQVGRKTIARALEALGEMPVPVYLLPGNHDPLNDASVYTNPFFLENKPETVRVVADAHPVEVDEGVELVGAPWLAKHPGENPLHRVLAELEPVARGVRIVLGHGAVDTLAGFSDAAEVIETARLREALADGRAHYIALGDKHSLTQVDGEGRIWYSGTPEVTDFDEPEPGWINLVEVDPLRTATRKIRTGAWRFDELRDTELTDAAGVDELLRRLREAPDKERCVLRLHVAGLLGLEELDRLRAGLEHMAALYAAFDLRQEGLCSRLEGDDAVWERFSGFAVDTVEQLRKETTTEARDALLLLLHLSREGDK